MSLEDRGSSSAALVQRGAWSRTDSILTALSIIALMFVATTVLLGINRTVAPVGYAIGDRFLLPRAINEADAPTLVVWIRSTCGPCIRSADFYRQVTMLEPKKARVVVMGTEPEEQLRRFTDEHRIQADAVVSTSGDWMMFRGTPTLLYLDADHTVQRVWYARLGTPAEETEVLNAVSSDGRVP